MFFGKKILIIGAGREGISAANYLGSSCEVSLFDDKKESELDKSEFKKLKSKPKLFFSDLPEKEKFNYVVRSPGVRPNHPVIRKLIKKGSQLTTPTNIFFELCPCPVIGVTGTKGKGTASTLIYEMLKSQNENVFLAGNIGIPALDILPQVNKNSTVILELSSFQLIDLKISPHIAVVLMITQEHLDWHLDARDYREAKKSIVKYQNENDFAFINKDYEQSLKFAKQTKGEIFFISTKTKTNGAYLENGEIKCEIVQKEAICKIADVLLPGKHNLENVLAAVAVAKLEGIPSPNIKNVLISFKGLKHRLELVKAVGGVKYFNDSYSTIPETAIAAISAFPKIPKILILGGSSKKSDFSSLSRIIIKDTSIKKLILIGEEADKIKSAIASLGKFKGEIAQNLKNMNEIVTEAGKWAKRGEVVIFSPACASFDMFKNYQDRGDQFVKAVEKL